MDQSLIASRVNDAAKICSSSSKPKFIGFLRPEETVIVKSVADKLGLRYSFYGGYLDAERVFSEFFPIGVINSTNSFL